MTHKIVEKINGYASVLRFITPILVSIVLYFLIQVHQDIKEMKICFAQHLAEHKILEVKQENRITTLETIVAYLVKKDEIRK